MNRVVALVIVAGLASVAGAQGNRVALASESADARRVLAAGGRAEVDPKTASLAEALKDWVGLLEQDDVNAAARARWARDAKAAEELKDQWARLREAHGQFDYRKWLDGPGNAGGAKRIGDATSFTVGGHEYDHLHAKWEKSDDGWRIASVFLCR